MKIQKLFLSILAAASLFAGCKEPEPEPTIPSLTVGQTELSFEQGGGTATLTVTSNRPWFITSDADWLAFNPSKGAASDSPVSVTVTALSNSSMDRTSSFKVSTDFDYRSVTVSQKGQKGEDPNVTPSGKGTLEDPYNVVAAINATSGLSWTSNDEYQTTGVVYVKGKISRIAEKGSFTDGGTFGNASFFISADGTTTKELQVYRCMYLGNKKYKSGQTDIKVGDEVIICGKLMNYKGNTPETDANNAYVYSLNGETGSQGGEEPEPKGTGTLEDPYNPAGAAAAVKDLTWTSNEEYESTGDVYVKGKISRIVDKGTYTESGTYGNASFFISEDGEQSGEFQVYRALYLGNKKFESGQTDIKVGDEVIIYGKLMNYRNNTPETVSGKCYLYSLNGVTGGDDPGPGPSGDPNGTGTLEDPYNPAGAAAAASKLTYTDKNNYETTEDVYVKGKICKIANNGTFTEGGTYGNASFFISEDGTGDGEFYVFRTLYLGNKKFEEGQTDIKVGDEVIIYGKLMNYRNNTPETVSGNSYLYSLNGVTGGDTPQPPTPGEVKAVTVAEFNAAPESDSQVYELVGTIGGSINMTYGNFDLTDETGTVYVYGLTATELGFGMKNDKSYESLGLKEGDKIKLHGYRGSFEGKIEVMYAWFIEKVSGGGDNPGPTGDPNGTGTLEDPYNPAGAAAAASKLTYTDKNNYETTEDVYVKGKICKIANSGTFTEGGTYGNASFFISEDGTGDGEFYVFRTLYLGNKKFEEGQTDIKVGDEVIICGKLMNYKGNTPETEANSSYLYSLNGVTVVVEPGSGGDTPGDGSTVSWKASTDWTGVADGAETISYKSGNFTITAKKEKSSNKPTVNSGANDCRVYAKGSLTITTSGDAMTSIVFNISSQGQKRLTDITVNTGTVTKQAKGDKTVTWTGSAKSVTFTVGEKAVYGSEGESKAGQFDFSSIVIK